MIEHFFRQKSLEGQQKERSINIPEKSKKMD